MAPQELRTGWHRRNADDYVFVWGSAGDEVDHKHRAIFIRTMGESACQVRSLEVGKFVEYLAQHHYRHTTEPPRKLPPDFPRNLFINKLA